jgi:hypothetical protein
MGRYGAYDSGFPEGVGVMTRHCENASQFNLLRVKNWASQ